MKISHIVPVDLLDLIEGRDFYMCLANIAIKNKEYLEFYKQQKQRGAFVLLDNGEAEGDQMSLDTIWKVVEQINPNEIILNDSLFNREETIKKSKQALDYYKSKGYEGQYMFVVQGKTFEDWIKCYEEFDMTNISTIGIPKAVVKWNDDTRLKCCEYLKDKNKQVHLLGCQNSIKELIKLRQYNFIRSNDTSLAFLLAKYYRDSNETRPEEAVMEFYNSKFNVTQVRMLERNIQTFDNI